MKLSKAQWHTLLRAITYAERYTDVLADRDKWQPSERAVAKANYSMLFTELFKMAPAEVRSELLNRVRVKPKVSG